MVSKSVRRLTFAGTKGSFARYESYDESHGELTTRVSITTNAWWDLDCPQVLTVTLEPGDRPNGLSADFASASGESEGGPVGNEGRAAESL